MLAVINPLLPLKSFNPLLIGEGLATSLKQKDGERINYVSIPFSSGRVLRLEVGALNKLRHLSFNPLLIGEGLATLFWTWFSQCEKLVSIPFSSGRVLRQHPLSAQYPCGLKRGFGNTSPFRLFFSMPFWP